MQRVWLFEQFAITVERIDFVDPALADRPDTRERGVRVEIRPTHTTYSGSVYASPTDSLRPAICRIDFLESRPDAADRMHWHPTMLDGEPGERTMEAGMRDDPAGWLVEQLENWDRLVSRARTEDARAPTADGQAVRAASAEIGACVDAGLAWARQTPWPPAVHDERGLA